jgi:hypothetical protein
MKCYLHIGTEKTGTTTLQKFLALNRDLLESMGYFYPHTLGNTNHLKLPLMGYEGYRPDDLMRLQDIYSDQDHQHLKKRTLSALQRELRQAASPSIILSSEHVQSRLRTTQEIQRLKEFLLQAGTREVVVIVYLRDPAELANSLYSTSVKCGATQSAPPPPGESEKYDRICNHKQTLENFSLVFGKEFVIPRVYAPREFEQKSVVCDFMGVVGLPSTAEYRYPRNANPTISAVGLELLRRVNQKLPATVQDKVTLQEKPNPLRGNIDKYFERYFSTSEKYVMPQELYKLYDETFEASNQYVREHWFPEREILFKRNRTHRMPLSITIPDSDLQGTADLIAKMWSSRQNNIHQRSEQRESLPGYRWFANVKQRLRRSSS